MRKFGKDRAPQDQAYEGQPAYLCVGSDRYPYTVSGVSKSGKSIYLQAAKHRAARRNDKGDLGSPQYSVFIPDPTGEIISARLGKDGVFRTTGSRVKCRVVLGEYDSYRDPSF